MAVPSVETTEGPSQGIAPGMTPGVLEARGQLKSGLFDWVWWVTPFILALRARWISEFGPAWSTLSSSRPARVT